MCNIEFHFEFPKWGRVGGGWCSGLLCLCSLCPAHPPGQAASVVCLCSGLQREIGGESRDYSWLLLPACWCCLLSPNLENNGSQFIWVPFSIRAMTWRKKENIFIFTIALADRSWCHQLTGLLKVNSFRRWEFSLIRFCKELWSEIAIKHVNGWH